MSEPTVPTPFEWMGGAPAIARLFERFYAKVPADPVLGPLFAAMNPEHASRVAAFVGEVLGGPPAYSAARGGHPTMIRAHLGRGLTEAQRKRWVDLLLACADEVDVPGDPEFRSAFVAYLEWGSRLAVINSAPGASADPAAPMPSWGWGEAKGPYVAPPKG
jgi:hemoglobin